VTLPSPVVPLPLTASWEEEEELQTPTVETFGGTSGILGGNSGTLGGTLGWTTGTLGETNGTLGGTTGTFGAATGTLGTLGLYYNSNGSAAGSAASDLKVGGRPGQHAAAHSTVEPGTRAVRWRTASAR
jgi:hypothetical protein